MIKQYQQKTWSQKYRSWWRVSTFYYRALHQVFQGEQTDLELGPDGSPTAQMIDVLFIYNANMYWARTRVFRNLNVNVGRKSMRHHDTRQDLGV